MPQPESAPPPRRDAASDGGAIRPGRSRSAIWACGAGLALVLCRLWLADAQALQIAGGALYDDALFVRLAEQVARGHWLGPYDHLTLAKGPFYPMWIAGAFLLGIPLVLSQHLLYVAASAAAVLALSPLLRSPWRRLAVFAGLLFNPATFAWGHMGHAIREGIYPALTLLVVAGALGTWLRAAAGTARLAAWGAATGLALGGFWLTREEGVWIVPALALAGALLAGRAWRADRRRARLALAALPGLLAVAAVAAVMLVNHARYGVFTAVEFKGGSFPAAYGSLLRIRHRHPDVTVPVPAAARQAAYAVSPALAELRPHLEGSLGERWSQYGGDGSDIHGGWFVWALREAAYLEGHHADGRAAEDYYRRLAREINAACDAGRLDCGPPRRGMRPPLAAAHARPFASTFVAGAALLADFRSLVTPAPFSWGPAEALARFRSVAGAESRPPLEADWIVQGWAFGLRPGLELALLDPAGEEVPSEVRWDPSPDVERHFADVGNYPGIEHCRFELRGTCSGTCALRLRRPDGRHWTIRLDGSRRSLDRPHAKAHLDAVLRAGEDQFGVHRRLDARRWDVVLAIGRAYTLVMPWLSAAALVAFAASGVGGLTRRSLHPAWLAGAVLLLAVGARLALVALIDATSFSALETRYLSSAYPLALLFVGLTLCTAADTVRRRPSRDDA